jgi:hypothetical protein
LVVIGEGHHLGVTDGWRMEAGKAEREPSSRWEHKGGGGCSAGIWDGVCRMQLARVGVRMNSWLGLPRLDWIPYGVRSDIYYIHSARVDMPYG